MDFISGGLAATGAVIVSNPFDVVKTRLQLQGELAARGRHLVHYKSSLHAVLVIARTEGIVALQRGLAVAINYQVLMNGTRLGLYQTADARGWTRSKNNEVNFPKAIMWGSIAGVLGNYVASPLYLVKTQIQSQCAESIVVGHQHGHEGIADAFRGIYRRHGFFGLWAGVASALPRTVVGSSSQLYTFSLSKDYLKNNDICTDSPIAAAFIASCLSGVVISTCMCPFDVVATRIFNQNRDSRGKGIMYKGAFDCMIKIYRLEGFFGYYKGYGALYLRLAPHTTVSLVLWDFFSAAHRRLYKMMQSSPA